MASKPSASLEHLGLFQLCLIVLSLVVLGALVADNVFVLPGEISRILHFVDNTVCVVFLVDFILRFRAAPSKLQFMKWGWIDLLASIPSLDSLRWGRAVRFFRLLRLLRGLRSLQRLFSILFAHRTRGGVTSVALISFLVVTFSSIGILVCERGPGTNIQSAEDAVWWSISTITTVGYGDRYPVTTAGRVVAACVMVIGVGLFGTLSGLVASLFLGKEEEKIETEESAILTEVRALRAEIAELRAAQGRSVDTAK